MADESGLMGVDAANAELDAMIANQTPDAATTPDSASTEQRAAQPQDATVQAQLDEINGTPAGAEAPEGGGQKPEGGSQKAEVGSQTTETKTEAKGGPEEKGSRFAKDAQRRDTSWKALNAEKEATAKEKAALAAERAAWQAEREQAEQAETVTPEKYQTYAQKQRANADHLTAEADRLEKAGNFDAAEQQREEARDCEAEIRKANRAAEELRKNPPPSPAQRTEKLAAEKREWTMKAATDFPDLGKDGSEFQKLTASYLQELGQQAPKMASDPKSIYFVSRLVAAETASARVPVMEKELSQMKARVKELESLTSPGVPGQPARPAGDVPFNQRSQSEQWQELETMAQGTALR